VLQLLETCKDIMTVRRMLEAGPKEERPVEKKTRNNIASYCLSAGSWYKH
jgi:hypothetical protein